MTDIMKEQLYRDYYPKVFSYIHSRIQNDSAEDITSDVFLKIYEKLDSFDETKSSLSTWIFTVTRNTLIDYYRTRKVYSEIPEATEAEDSIEDDVCNAEMLSALTKALSQMEERERDIIILRYYDGKTLREIAEQMGISYAYVKILQNKAFAFLKDFLE